jgi:hypothetical protein
MEALATRRSSARPAMHGLYPAPLDHRECLSQMAVNVCSEADQIRSEVMSIWSVAFFFFLKSALLMPGVCEHGCHLYKLRASLKVEAYRTAA